ncbi:reverse transcriptase domain-containing protein [Tanacetum coccineum]
MEKIFQIFQDLRFDISFGDALLLMPRFAPTIKSLLMNKEKLLKLAKIPLNENCSAMLLKKIPEKLGDPDKFLIPCNFPGIEIYQDFSKIARPMTHLLEKETPFVFSKGCIDAFQTLKKKLSESPILVVPDWSAFHSNSLSDASEFRIGAVLGQRKMKHIQSLYIMLAKLLTEAQIIHYHRKREMASR